MLSKFVTPLALAVLISYAYQWWTAYRVNLSVEKYQRSAALNSTILADHVSQFDHAKVVKVTDDIYVAIGYTLGNSILLVGPDGLVIIDTTESLLGAQKIFAEFRKISDKPVRAIVYTHNHVDHVLGSEAFLADSGDRNAVEIWAHHTLEDYVKLNAMIGKAHYTRAMRQFGVYINPGEGTAGIGFRLRYKDKVNPFVPPNRFLYKDRMSIQVAGLQLELLHIPGETDDQIAVYWPSKKALFCADDVYKAFPNLYAIRGNLFRSLELWKSSLDLMRSLQSEFLVPSHTLPIVGADQIFSILTDYRDAVQLVHDQTVRYMNKGLHPNDIAQRIKLPEKLKSSPYLQELYGTVHWSSKGLFSGYMGWFSGEASELNPYTPVEASKRLVRLGGGIERVLEVAAASLADGDLQWALQLATSVLHVDTNHAEAKEIRAKALVGLAHQQTSMNGRHYYLTAAEETLGKVHIAFSKEQIADTIRTTKLKDLFKLLSIRVDAEACPDLDKVVHFQFPDIKMNVDVHMRNGIWDLSGQLTRPPDVNVTVTSVTWREVLTGDTVALLTALSSELQVEPGLMALREVMNCLDTSM